MVTAHTEAITSLAMNREGSLLITGSLDRTAKIWDLQTRESVATLTGHQAAVNSVAIGRSGELLATASADGTILIWQYRRRTSPDGDALLRLRIANGTSSLSCGETPTG
jgi:WD40 repeat protein